MVPNGSGHCEHHPAHHDEKACHGKEKEEEALRFGDAPEGRHERRKKQVPRRKCLALHSVGDGPIVHIQRGHHVIAYGLHAQDEIAIVSVKEGGTETVISILDAKHYERDLDVTDVRLAVRRLSGDSPVDVMIELDDRRQMKDPLDMLDEDASNPT
jgi:hypothetical protein